MSATEPKWCEKRTSWGGWNVSTDCSMASLDVCRFLHELYNATTAAGRKLLMASNSSAACCCPAPFASFFYKR